MSPKPLEKKARLHADPCLSVADLSKIFESWLTLKLSKDLHQLLSPPNGKSFTWKTQPNHEWLAAVAPLFAMLAKAVPNTVLTSKKMLLVLQQLLTKKKIVNTTKMEESTFFDWCDQTIRILFAKFREVKREQSTNLRVQRRCSNEEWVAIQTVIDSIILSDEEPKPDNIKHVTLSPPKSWSSWASTLQDEQVAHAPSALVAVSNQPTPTPEQPQQTTLLNTDVSIFKTILSQDNVSIKQTESEQNDTNTRCRLLSHTPDMDSPSSDTFTPKESEQIQSWLTAKQSSQVKPTVKKPKQLGAKSKATKKANHNTDIDIKVLKHRATSAAYKKTYKEALKHNTEEVAKQLARAAYRKAAAEYA
jgi:hypothetical protein